MIYHELPIVCAGLQPKEDLLNLAWDVHQLLAILHRGDGDARVNDVRVLDMPALLDWASSSPANYRWLQQLGAELCNKYALHEGARVGCEEGIKKFFRDPPKGMVKLMWKFTSPQEHFK